MRQRRAAVGTQPRTVAASGRSDRSDRDPGRLGVAELRRANANVDDCHPAGCQASDRDDVSVRYSPARAGRASQDGNWAQYMRQLLMNMSGVTVARMPRPTVRPGTVLIRVRYSLVSVGTEIA